MAWTARYRFKVSKSLSSEAKELNLVIGGRPAVVSGDGEKSLNQSEWLTLNIHDLENEDTAREFGRSVTFAVLLAGIRSSAGIDGGENQATGQFSEAVANLLAGQGRKLMRDVHGLLTYERTGTELFMGIRAEGSVRTDPSQFLNEITLSFDEAAGLGEREQTALMLIGLSKIAIEPLAEAVLCLSAVEFLATETPWTPAQFALLTQLQEQAKASTELPRHEAEEVAKAIRDSVFKSIRQSIKRKMTVLGLSQADWKAFDAVYSLRSGIFHGSKRSRGQHAELVGKARDICDRIVMAAIKKGHSDC